MAAISAHGTILKAGDAANNVEDIANVTSISGPGLTLETIDVTNHSSASNWREFIGGLKDGGEVNIDISYEPAGATHKNAAGGLLYFLTTRAIAYFSLTFPNTGVNTVWSFTALVASFEPSIAVGDALTASVTLKITGAPVLL